MAKNRPLQLFFGASDVWGGRADREGGAAPVAGSGSSQMPGLGFDLGGASVLHARARAPGLLGLVVHAPWGH